LPQGTVRDDVSDDDEDDVGADAPPAPLQRKMSEHVVTRWYRAPEVIRRFRCERVE
jgi:hypothetical protein